MSNTLGDRIKILRGSLTQRQFAEKIDIPATTLGNYEKNKSELNFATIDLFTKTFGINTDWLIFGRGPMHSSDTPISHQETITQPEVTVRPMCQAGEQTGESRRTTGLADGGKPQTLEGKR